MFPPSPVLPNVTVKGYRELVKKLRTQHEDVSTSSTLFLQAKQMAISSLKSRGEKAKLNPGRAFTRKALLGFFNHLHKLSRCFGVLFQLYCEGYANPEICCRLRNRIVEAKKGLRKIKDDKKVELRASFEALKEQRLAKLQARALDQDVAVLGTNGLFRVSWLWP